MESNLEIDRAMSWERGTCIVFLHGITNNIHIISQNIFQNKAQRHYKNV